MKYVEGPAGTAVLPAGSQRVVAKSRSELPEHEAFLALVERAAAARPAG
jgi:tryptophan halogenase